MLFVFLCLELVLYVEQFFRVSGILEGKSEVVCEGGIGRKFDFFLSSFLNISLSLE